MLSLRRLEALAAVVEHGTFSAAAEALSYSQSAVSQSIARLESEVGTPLLRRGAGGVSLTAAGARLAEHAGRILAAVADAEADLAQITDQRLTRLRVGSFPSGGAALMPLAVARLRRVRPDVSLTLAEDEPAPIAARLRAGELDLALLFEFPDAAAQRRVRAGLRTTVLLEDPLALVLPAEHRLAGRASVGLSELRAESWVQTSAHSPCARYVVRLCEGAGFVPGVAFESDDYGTVQGLVAAGVGVALVPRLALGAGHPGVVVRPLTPASPVRRITVATPAGVAASPAARAMVRELTAVARRHVAAQPASA